MLEIKKKTPSTYKFIDNIDKKEVKVNVCGP